MDNEYEEDIGGVPAFCLKTRDTKTQRKVFLNFCHNRQIPEPMPSFTEEQFTELLQTPHADQFKIPLICKSLYYTKDKSGNQDAVVVDIIINTDFYKQSVKTSEIFRTFLVTVALDTVEEKFENNEEYEAVKGWSLCKDNWTILKNKKYQPPMLDNPVRKPKLKPQKSISNSLADASPHLFKSDLFDADGRLKKIKIFEDKQDESDEPLLKPTLIKSNTDAATTNHISPKLITEINDQDSRTNSKFNLWLYPRKREILFQMNVSKVPVTDEMMIHVNHDRLKIDTQKGMELVDIFLPVLIDSDKVQAPRVDPQTQLLTLNLPLKSQS